MSTRTMNQTLDDKRICACCFEPQPRAQYTPQQWAMGQGVSLCHGCARNATAISSCSRHNISDKAKFEGKDLNKPFAKGSFRWVAKGRYTSGPREGEPCVCKWFKDGGVLQKHYFASDIAASEMATRLIERWNGERFLPGNKTIRINLPQVWTSSKPPHVKVLAEPFIQNYRKYNSNSGWADTKTDWACVMQAISHYSFHVSNGNLLLCDLQGGINRDGAVLTDPVVMSFTREYGPTDLGRRGIQNFFAKHKCNKYCQAHWLKPRERKNYHSAQSHTMMMVAPTTTQSSMRSTVTVQTRKNNMVVQKEVPVTSISGSRARPGLFRAMSTSSARTRAPLKEVNKIARLAQQQHQQQNQQLSARPVPKQRGPLGRPLGRSQSVRPRPEVVLVQI